MSNRWPGGIVRKTPVTPAGPLQSGAASGVWSLADAAYWTKQGLWPLAGNVLAVEDVFSTYLYTGTSANQTITNGIDLAGKGGMVWLKARSIGIENHYVYDTNRGASKFINTNRTNAQTDYSAQGWFLDAFTSTGFTLDAIGDGNSNGVTYASWTFREAPKFFDVVTYTGDGTTGRAISHNLGIAPGMIVVKAVSSTSNWFVYHRSTPDMGMLNTVDSFSFSSRITSVTSSSFTVSSSDGGIGATNVNGVTYVAYLYAHDTTADGFIQCGSYTGTGVNPGPTVTLGWEPQWVMIKRATGGTGDWYMFDNMRGLTVQDGTSGDAALRANVSGAEFDDQHANPTSTGFQVRGIDASSNGSGSTYIYMAIRRGPMRTPTLGTSVFSPYVAATPGNAVVTTNFPVDLQIQKNPSAATDIRFVDRLRGVSSTPTNPSSAFPLLVSNSTSAETTGTTTTLNWNNTGFTVGDTYAASAQAWAVNLRRAPGFFDEVCYTGNGGSAPFNHNLGVAPELIITKRRGSTSEWNVGTEFGATTFRFAELNLTTAYAPFSYNTATYFGAQPTATQFYPGNASGSGASGSTYVAYLFASCPGVSKVGSYTGNGSSQTINCAFTTGARFVLIKRTDSTGGWLVWDSARGIVAGNDPYLALNTSTAQVTSDDSVDTDNTGFIVNQVAASNVNVNAATYIFLAIS